MTPDIIHPLAEIAFYKIFPIVGTLIAIGCLLVCTTAKEW